MKLEECTSGTRVRVVTGSLSGREGTVESIKPQLVQFPVLVVLDQRPLATGWGGIKAFAPDELETA